MALAFVLFVRRNTGQGTVLKAMAGIHRHQRAAGSWAEKETNSLGRNMACCTKAMS